MTLYLSAKAAKDGAGTTIIGGVNMNDESGAGTGPNDQAVVLIDSTQHEILGTTADAKNTATDTTAVSAVSIWKQISASVQAIATSIAGTITVATHAVTGSGNFASTVADGANTTLGAKADAKSTATDTTAISAMSVWKQISASVQTIAAGGGGSVVTSVDGGFATLGAKADAKSTATDTTAISAMSVFKQISASIQAAAASLATLAGSLTTLGQTTSSASEPVVIASDQSPIPILGFQVTCSTDITRPADTNVYTINDAFANSTSAPTAGGATLTGAGRISGGSGIITDIYVMSSVAPSTPLQGELHIFDSAPTAENDNAAWSLSAAEAKLRVAVVPFTLITGANDSCQHIQNLNIGFTCVGTANLRYLVKVKNAYTPASAEVLTVRAKIIQTN